MLHAQDLADNVDPATEGNYYVDQLAMTLVAWGNTVARDLQLGYVMPGLVYPLFSVANTANPQVVFIWNNNAIASAGGGGGPSFNHFEGLDPLPAGTAPGPGILNLPPAPPSPSAAADDGDLPDYDSDM